MARTLTDTFSNFTEIVYCTLKQMIIILYDAHLSQYALLYIIKLK